MDFFMQFFYELGDFLANFSTNLEILLLFS